MGPGFAAERAAHQAVSACVVSAGRALRRRKRAPGRAAGRAAAQHAAKGNARRAPTRNGCTGSTPSLPLTQVQRLSTEAGGELRAVLAQQSPAVPHVTALHRSLQVRECASPTAAVIATHPCRTTARVTTSPLLQWTASQRWRSRKVRSAARAPAGPAKLPSPRRQRAAALHRPGLLLSHRGGADRHVDAALQGAQGAVAPVRAGAHGSCRKAWPFSPTGAPGST